MCMVLTAGPENQDGSSLPRVRSGLLLAAKAAVRHSLLPSLTIHTGNHLAAPPEHSPVPAVTRAAVPGSRALRADRLPVPQKHILHTVLLGGMATLPYWGFTP